jgi:predicted dinucleotide-binding enzyme
MKIAIIGAGHVGGTLGKRWTEVGHEVVFGVSDPSDPKHGDLVVKTSREAIEGVEVVVLAVPYGALIGLTKELDFADRVILDCTNPISADFSGLNCEGPSGAEEVAEWTGSSKVVKIFNTVGFNIMANPVIDGQHAAMLYAGDDASAKATAAKLASDIGFNPIDAGPLSQAHWLESFAWLWISMAVKYGQGRDFAFAFLKR